jgi:hypothetical protein
MSAKPTRNWAKIGGLLGLLAGEIYMVFTVTSPRLRDVDIPTSALLTRMAATAPLFGSFGLALGTGIGLILRGLFASKSDSLSHSSDSNPSKPE